jgi:hypothetical protein
MEKEIINFKKEIKDFEEKAKEFEKIASEKLFEINTKVSHLQSLQENEINKTEIVKLINEMLEMFFIILGCKPDHDNSWFKNFE